jgi:polyhydroxyalkanoate synthesis regulator phasin
MVTGNDDALRSFLSMGAQMADEIRRRLDEAAENVGAKDTSSVDVNEIADQVLNKVKQDIETEVERVITKLGLAREDELAALRNRIEKLEK